MDSLSQPHVLVLDPDPSLRVLVTAVLQRCGLRVTAADGEREAAELSFRRGRYAAIILSSDMPRFASLLHELNAAPAAERPAVIIAATSETTLPPIQADLVLMKPFHLEELYAAIAACCGGCGDERLQQRNASRSRSAGATPADDMQP